MRGYKIIFIAFMVGAIGGSGGTYLFFKQKNSDDLSERKNELLIREKEIIKEQEKTKEQFYNDVITVSESNYVITISNQIITW